MKIMLDTNILVSALVFDGIAGRVFDFLLNSQHQIYVSEYVDAELRDKLFEKWPEQAFDIYKMYKSLNIDFCKSTNEILASIRDKKRHTGIE